MRDTWSFSSAGELVFGTGAVDHIGKKVAALGLRRIFVVTDPRLAQAGIVDQVLRNFQGSQFKVCVFEGGEPEPSLRAAADAVSEAERFQPDAILGLGGGSNLDLAKMTSVLYAHKGAPNDYFSFDNVPGPIVPVIGVPTTAGTGSEVSHAAVLTDTENKMKVSTLSPYLRPALAVVDANLTLTCPPQVTADSGIDALTHAVEAFCAINSFDLEIPSGQSAAYSGKNPLGDAIAEKAIRLVGEHLVTAVREPDNLKAREGMSLASTLAGIAFSNCAVAVVHALEYPMGGELHCSHGAGNGMLLPFVMAYNLPVREREIAQIGGLLGRDTFGMNEHEAALDSIAAVSQLKKEIGIPERIRDIGGAREQLPIFAEKAFGITRLMQLNPRKPTVEELLQILEAAY